MAGGFQSRKLKKAERASSVVAVTIPIDQTGGRGLIARQCLHALLGPISPSPGLRAWEVPVPRRPLFRLYRVKDDHGHWLAFVYAKEDNQVPKMPNYLTWDEARRVAKAIARLPELLQNKD